tara:strand:+ start:114 stop:554 length:441 start_codon:yes stop_codon:yes gene_type:complete
MKFISHRGNVNGRNELMENHPLAIQMAMNAGFDVEVDVWFTKAGWYLGHDKPQYAINPTFLSKEGLWCHAKDIETLKQMLLYPQIHCFWHQTDDVTLTSRNFIWTYPGKESTENSVCVLANKDDKIPEKCFGICSDFIMEYINEYK